MHRSSRAPGGHSITCLPQKPIDNQRLALKEIAHAHSDWQVVASYTDEGISGSKGRNRRPGFDRLVKDAIRRRFDLVAAVSVDRLGRSLQDLVAFKAIAPE